MNMELLQTESVLSSFFEYVKRSAVQGGKVDVKQIEQVMTVMKIMKTLYIAEMTVKSLMEEGGLDEEMGA